MSNIRIETRAFKPVYEQYPDVEMSINELWSEVFGWVSYADAIKLISSPKIYTMKGLLRKFKDRGFDKVVLNIHKRNKLEITTDYEINKLVMAS